MRSAAGLGPLVLLSCACFGQGVVEAPGFEVASVRLSQRTVGKDAAGPISIGRAGLSGRNVTLKSLLAEAYQLQPHQIAGGPGWLDISEYDIEAKAGNPVTREQILLMLRSLLAERFHLSLHRETRELRVYELVVDKAGPKIHPGADADVHAAGRGVGPESFRGDMRQFANLLSVRLSIPALNDPGKPGMASGPPIPVVDKTGLQGVYDIGVDLKPELGVDMFTLWQRALQDQLGLKLENRRTAVEVYVVDRAERVPAAN